jgi:hypothetical protein
MQAACSGGQSKQQSPSVPISRDSQRTGQIALEYLPPYTPDLNPVGATAVARFLRQGVAK